MKKIFYSLAVLGLATLSGCSEEGLVSENDGQVTLSVSLPDQIESRAYSDGLKATNLHYAVYEVKTGKTIFASDKAGSPAAVQAGDRKFTLTLNLVKGKDYNLIFWADQPSAPYTFSSTTKSVTVDYTNPEGNAEVRDAFFQVVKGLEVTGPMTTAVELRRPFGQLNVGTDDLEEAKEQGTTIKSTSVTVSDVYTTLNLLTGIASNGQEITFSATGIPTGETFPVTHSDANKSYSYLAMDYILTGSVLEAGNDVQKAQREVKDVKFVMSYENGQTETIEMTSVPFQRNYRTNIYGTLILAPNNFNIVIDQNYFEDPGILNPVE